MARGMAWPVDVVAQALALHSRGSSSYAIARELSVPRATVANWCTGGAPRRPSTSNRCRACRGRRHELPPAESYAYLLGVYLGDGYLTTPGRAVWLCVAMDAAYPGIVSEVRQAMAAVLAFRTSHVARPRGTNLVLIRSYGREWLCLLPQHGPGRKHRRRIALRGWQHEIVAAHPGAFLRGLIHSDGWRGVNRVRAKGRDYTYPRYQFSNRSDDIRALFTLACDLLGIEWRRWAAGISR